MMLAIARAMPLLALLAALACNGSTPVEPDPVYSISGTVRSDLTNQGLEGVSVQLQGTNFTVTTPTSGAFSFGGLGAGSYSVRLSRSGFTDQTRNVVLDRTTGSVALDVTLVHLPFADLVQEGVITSTANPPDFSTWSFRAAGRNRGDGCAGSIGVVVELLNGLSQTFARREFALPSDLVVQPGARFEYESCCFSSAELDQLTFYRATFTYSTVSCG